MDLSRSPGGSGTGRKSRLDQRAQPGRAARWPRSQQPGPHQGAISSSRDDQPPWSTCGLRLCGARPRKNQRVAALDTAADHRLFLQGRSQYGRAGFYVLGRRPAHGLKDGRRPTCSGTLGLKGRGELTRSCCTKAEPRLKDAELAGPGRRHRSGGWPPSIPGRLSLNVLDGPFGHSQPEGGIPEMRAQSGAADQGERQGMERRPPRKGGWRRVFLFSDVLEPLGRAEQGSSGWRGHFDRRWRTARILKGRIGRSCGTGLCGRAPHGARIGLAGKTGRPAPR